MKQKNFKGFFINCLMKKEVSILEVLFVIIFAPIFFFLFIVASKIKISFVSLSNGALMWIVVILIWVIYILYLWRILKNEKKKSKSKK